MAKPFRDPIDDEADMAEGTRRSMAELESAIAADPDATVEVPVGADEDEPDPDEELDRAPERPSRSERRAERGASYRTIREQRAAAEARAQALEEQLQFERSNRLTQAHPSQAQEPDQAKKYEDEAKGVYKAQSDLLEEYNRKFADYQRRGAVMPAAEYQSYSLRAEELEQKKLDALLNAREARRAPARAAEEQARLIQAKAPDVFGNQRAADWARGEWSRRIAENPNANREQLFDEVVEGARRAILGKRPPPDQITRQRATGLSRGAGASSGNAPASIQLSKGQRSIARAAYPKLSPDKAYQRWANENGRELVEMERETGRRA